MTDNTIARRGFFPIVAGDEVTVHQASSNLTLAANDLSVTQGGGSLIAAGGNATISEGGAAAVLAAGNVEIRRGGAILALARTVSVSDGFVGVALGRDVDMHDVKVMLGAREAAVAGAVAGVVFGFLRLMFRKGEG